MIDASDPEFIRLLARLKLSVRRQLEYNIDLARLQKDAQQALEVLKEIEDMAEDEELLALILRLRAIIMQNSSKDVLERRKSPILLSRKILPTCALTDLAHGVDERQPQRSSRSNHACITAAAACCNPASCARAWRRSSSGRRPQARISSMLPMSQRSSREGATSRWNCQAIA